MQVTVRPEQPGDVAAIRAVHEAAFPTPAEAGLVDLLRERGKSTVSLVAVLDEQIVGHILFSPVTIEGDRWQLTGAGLAPMAVLPARQRAGIGSRLVTAGLQACREKEIPYVVVLGWPEFYPRFGFERGSRRGIGNEYWADESFMVQELTQGSLPGPGIARYAPELAEAFPE